MNNENDIVTLIAVANPIEANIMKSKLESEGIPCFVADTNTIGINPLYSNALGGIRVQVQQADLVRAAEILSLHGEVKKNHCPKCHSTEVNYSKLPSLFNVLSFLGLGVFFPALRRTWTCVPCQHKWR